MEKPKVRAKGINHPKRSVEALRALLTRKSANFPGHLDLSGRTAGKGRCHTRALNRAISRYQRFFDSTRRHSGKLNLEKKIKYLALV